jgi:hypothetical protein
MRAGLGPASKSALQLLPDAGDVLVLLARAQLALTRLAAGIADHAGAADDDGMVPSAAGAPAHHGQRANVEARSGGIKPM